MIDHFLDIYSKLLIGVISFIAPLTSYLLSIYLNDRELMLERLETKKNALDSLIDDAFVQGKKDGLTPKQILESGNAILKTKEKEASNNLKRINYLNPKSKIAWLFFYLIVSMFSLLVDSLVRGDVFNSYNHKLSTSLLGVSCLAFILAIIMLLRVLWKLIESKELIMKEKNEIKEYKKIETNQLLESRNEQNDHAKDQQPIPVEPEI